MKKRGLAWLVLAALVACVAAGSALAQSGGGYDLSWSTIDGGGGASSGGAYAVGGTAGQWDVGLMSGGGYTLAGGFWPGGALAGAYHVYLPLVVR